MGEERLLTPEVLAILDSALEGVMIADAQMVVRYVNPAYIRVTGLSPEQEIGRTLSSQETAGPLREAIETGRPVYGRRYHPPGSNAELVVNTSPIVVNGTVIGGVSFCQDISDIMQLTEKLSQSTQAVQLLSERLDDLASARYTMADVIGESTEIQAAVQMARRAAEGRSTVLLTGESGTGKEIFAQAIHNASPRKKKPFIRVNCAAVPEQLMESEFFGHEKGAFTGAGRRKMGLFELAHQGTLFLDEVGDMSLFIQAKVLRVLQEGEIYRVGGEQPLRVDVRVIAATNRDLDRLIAAGQFREDLYFRLNVMRIELPPLRRRREDIPLLTEHLVKKLNRKLGRQVRGVDREALRLLMSYDWPGNVRELENVLERAINLSDGDIITARSLLLPGHGQAENGETLNLAQQERRLIHLALQRYGTSVEGKRKAARALGISLATLYKRLKEERLVSIDEK